MAIQDATGSITHSAKDISSDIDTAASDVEGIVGGSAGVNGGFLGIGGIEDFAGMSQEGKEQFKSAVSGYVDGLKSIISDFNPDADMENALKGEVATAVHDFLAAMKELLQAYVSELETENRHIDEAYANWEASAKSIASSATSDAGDVRGKASSLSVD